MKKMEGQKQQVEMPKEMVQAVEKLLQAMKKIDREVVACRDKAAFIERRLDQMSSAVSDTCRHIAACLCEYDRVQGDPVYLERKLRPLLETFGGRLEGKCGLEGALKTWSMCCSEVVWRMIRDLALQWSSEEWREEKWEKSDDKKMEEAEMVEGEDKKVQDEETKVHGGEKQVKLPEVDDDDMKVEDEDTKMAEGEELVGVKDLQNGLQNASMKWDSFTVMKLDEGKMVEPSCIEQHLLKLQIMERDLEVKALMRRQSQQHFDWLQAKLKLLC
ncbi:MAG: hypothetical protein GY772_19370 [bacterium]|nr:hypothetical protein [bacterium]